MINQLEKEINLTFPDRLTWQKRIPTFHPESSAEAAEVFRMAAKLRQSMFINGFGNNINPVGDEFNDLLILKTDRLNHIIETNNKDFYISVGAGYPLIEINKALAGDGLWFAFGDTSYPGSFGGALAVGLTVSDGTHDLPLMRNLLAVTAVLPDGNIIKPGAKTFKSVSGYDFSRIFFNSWGLLGMVSVLTFRVLPLSKKDETPRMVMKAPDRVKFLKDFTGDTPIGEMCRKIKAEYDPDNLLDIV